MTAENIRDHPGAINDAEKLETLLQKLIDAGDIRAVFAAVSAFALLNAGNVQHALATLKTAYGRTLNLQALKAEIKTERKRQSAERRAKRSPERAAGAASLPTVCVNGRWTLDVAQEIFTHLVAAQEHLRLYHRGDGLVRVIHKSDNTVTIVSIDEEELHQLIDITVRCVSIREDEEGGTVELPADPPRAVLTHILKMRRWPGIPVLTGVTDAPYIRADGQVCSVPGYDGVAKLLYILREGLVTPEIPEHPTQEDARAAAAALLETLRDYPFAGESGPANVLGAALTLALREAIDGPVPNLTIGATKAGSGKTHLAEWIAAAGLGIAESTLDPWPQEEPEIKKKMLSKLAVGKRYIIFDNVRGAINSPTLEGITTSRVYQDRLLGMNEEGGYPVKFLTMFTMNGPRSGGDQYRRAYFVNLDCPDPHPEQRDPDQFTHGEIGAYIRAHAGELLAYTLTMARAWYVAGCPKAEGIVYMGSFEAWCRIVASVLAFAGVSGFLATQREDAELADEEGEQWEAWLLALHAQNAGQPFTANHLASLILDNQTEDPAQTLPAYLAGQLDKSRTAIGFGQQIGSAFWHRRGRRFGRSGVRIVAAGKDSHRKVAQWQIVTSEEKPAGGGAAPKSESTPAPSYACPSCGETAWSLHEGEALGARWHCGKCGLFDHAPTTATPPVQPEPRRVEPPFGPEAQALLATVPDPCDKLQAWRSAAAHYVAQGCPSRQIAPPGKFPATMQGKALFDTLGQLTRTPETVGYAYEYINSMVTAGRNGAHP